MRLSLCHIHSELRHRLLLKVVKRRRRETESGNVTAEGTSAVFIDTSLDTRLVTIVSDSDTFSLLRKKLMLEHLQCFPELGEIKIHALKVKRKGHFYHLSDSMLVKSAFEGVKKSWFLSVDASSLKQCGENQQSHGPNVRNQLPLLYLTHNPSGNGHNIIPDHTSTSAVHESSLLELVKAQCTNQKVQLSLSDCRREISKDMGTEVKHITSEHFKNVTSDSNRMPDLKIQEKYDVTSKGTRISGTTVEHDGNNSRTGVSYVQCSNLLEPSPETGPVVMKKQKIKKNNKDEVGDRSSKENIASNHASGEVASLPEIVGPANSLVNTGRKFSNGMKMGNKDDNEEHLTTCASPSSNKSDLGSNRKSNMGVQIGEISSIHDRYENKNAKNIVDVQCNNFCEEALPSGPAAKKRHMTESQEVSRNPLKENEVLISNSDNYASKPKINKLGNSTEDEHNSRNIDSNGLFTEPHDNDYLRTNSGIAKKSKKKKRKMDETYNLSSALDHIATVLPSVQDAGGEGTFKENGEINPNHLVKPSEVEIVLGDSVKPGTLSQLSRIYQKKKHGELVQEVVEGNVLPSSSIGTDKCERDTCNVDGKVDLSGIAVGSAVKGAKRFKKHDTTNRKVIHPLHVTEVISLNNNISHSANENVFGEDQKMVSDQINIEEEREISLKHDSELLLSEKSKPLDHGGADVHIKGPVSSADLVNAKAVMESGNFSGSTRKKKRAKKSAAILCQTERDESEQKPTNASSMGANREGNYQSENEAGYLPQAQMNKDLSQNNCGKSSDFLQPTHMSRGLKSSENVCAISSEKMKEIKQSTAKGLQNSPNKRQANAVKSLQLNQVEGGRKTEEIMDKRKKNQNSAAKNCQDIPDEVVEVGAEELATSNDRMRDVDNTSKRTKKTRSVEPSAVNVDLDSSTEHIAKNVDLVHVRSANTLENMSRKKEAKVDTHNQVEVSKCEGDGIDFKHYFMPGQHQNEVVCADKKGTTRSERDMKTRKNPKKIVLASSRTLADLPNSLQSYDNQESEVKSHIKSSSGIDPQESISKDVSNEFLLSSKKSSEVSGNGVKAPRSNDSGQIKTPQPAQIAGVSENRAPAPSPAYIKGKKVSSIASSSSSESSDKSLQDRRNKNRVSSLDLLLMAGRKASTKNTSEVISSSQQEKSLLTTPGFIFRDDGSESSASEDGSNASTRTPSDNVSSLDLDGESESSMDSLRNGSNGVEGRESGQNIEKPHSSQLKNVTMDMIFRSSNRYKKAKLTAESQPEDSESQPVDCVPDSQGNL